MKILIPMAGAGSRFVEKGYKQHKPAIPTTDRRTGQKIPMVVAAVRDLPFDPQDPANILVFVIRDFHKKDGLDEQIKAYFPTSRFIVIDKLTEGQACTCLLAKELIDNDEPLIIAACDNGMQMPPNSFEKQSREADAILFTFRGNDAVQEKPQAYGWVKTEGTSVRDVSVKVPVSDNPIRDHAIVGTFWFRRGRDFVKGAEDMIAADDRVNGEFYVDQVFRYILRAGLKTEVLELERYLCWGTPADYEAYENTLSYWSRFLKEEKR